MQIFLFMCGLIIDSVVSLLLSQYFCWCCCCCLFFWVLLQSILPSSILLINLSHILRLAFRSFLFKLLCSSLIPNCNFGKHGKFEFYIGPAACKTEFPRMIYGKKCLSVHIKTWFIWKTLNSKTKYLIWEINSTQMPKIISNSIILK